MAPVVAASRRETSVGHGVCVIWRRREIQDYDIGVRMRLRGMATKFCILPAEVDARRERRFGLARPRPRLRRIRAPLCVREYFPDDLRASYRQKARRTSASACRAGATSAGPNR